MMCALAAVTCAQSRYEVTHIDSTLNTIGGESAAMIVEDSILLYTSMRNDETSSIYLIDFAPMLVQLFQASIAADGTLGKGELSQWGINSKGKDCGNAAYDARNGILYFTMRALDGKDETHIYYTRRSGKRWDKVQLLGGDVNVEGYSSTHPTVAYLPDGKVILYFSSDRPGGLGGYDIWYTTMLTGHRPSNCTNLGAPVNSDSNEVTPFYDMEEGMLYFSSNCAGGLGGYDIYQSQGQRNSWQPIHNLGKELNSAYNDLYYYVQPCHCRCPKDSLAEGETLLSCGFLTSNRTGSLYISDSNCCNDIYRWRRISRPTPQVEKPVVQQPPLRPQDLLPLSLYFDNDQPDAKCLDTTTALDYTQTWRKYIQLRDIYKGTQPSPVDRRKWDSIQQSVDVFFKSELEGGRTRMLQFFELLLADLQQGKKVCLTVNGYASPLFESEYNVNLSARRISCFKNELLHWNGEALLPYYNTGCLKIETEACGAPNLDEVAATDPLRNPANAKSVYSINAARDRRIDVVGYRYF